MAEVPKPAADAKEEAAHFQQLLRELAITEGSATSDGSEDFDQIAYIIKQILQTGKEDVFADQLAGFIHKKENEIEKMCSFHYQVNIGPHGSLSNDRLLGWSGTS